MGTFSPVWFWRSRVLWWRCSAGQHSLACTWRSSPQRRPPWSYSSPAYQLQRVQGTRYWPSHLPHRGRGWNSVSPKLSSWTRPCTSYSTFWGWEVRLVRGWRCVILDNVAERRSVIEGFPPRVTCRWHFVDELLVHTSCLVIVFFFRSARTFWISRWNFLDYLVIFFFCNLFFGFLGENVWIS